jgi:hypothetical protein
MDKESFQESSVRPESYDPARASIAGAGPSKATLLTRCHARVFLQIMEYRLSKPALSMLCLQEGLLIALNIQGSFPAFATCRASSDIAIPKYPRPRFA